MYLCAARGAEVREERAQRPNGEEPRCGDPFGAVAGEGQGEASDDGGCAVRFVRVDIVTDARVAISEARER
jgi:hypothetical protein